MLNNNLYNQNKDILKINDAMQLLENLLNSKRHNDVMKEIKNIKLSNLE
ncbi:hypothetical protein J6Q66_07560 [bacterium]|nr:hypothetical protein [bacterium]